MRNFNLHLMLILGLALLSGCATSSAASGLGQTESKGLGIVGYNYTDKYIHFFTVNGAGGANIYEHNGGGKISCCVSFNPKSKLPFPVHVRWTDSYHKVPRIGNFGDLGYDMVREWKEKTVTFKGPVPANPRYFEVYFYPNDEIQIGITSDKSNYYDHAPEGEKR